MAIVRSGGALATFAAPPDLTVRSSGLQSQSPETYAAIYRTQPSVRTVIDFLARNIAQLSLHAYRRVSDLDRERLVDYPVVEWIEHPTAATTHYRLIESLIQDLGIYYNAYWLKMRQAATGSVGLLRIPPEDITAEGWMVPTGFVWTWPDGSRYQLPRNDVVYFNGYDPADPIRGLSPLETLRQILAEDAASTAYRRAYWTNSARLEGVITRPAGLAKWTAEQKQAFREQWQARFSGAANAGQTAVLEDGMTFTPTSYSARDSEFTIARKLTREEVAAAYHVPLPMVGILDHATFSNIKEQHKQLYADTLGPWLTWLEEEFERQLVPECNDVDRIYLEFNIAEKLKGSFEEQAASLAALIGRPIMTANEGRARLNLPSITDDPSADELALPLNTSGGPSASVDVQSDPTVAPDLSALSLTAGEWKRIRPVLRATRRRQVERLQKSPDGQRSADFFADFDRWNAELTNDLQPVIGTDRAAALALDMNAAVAAAAAAMDLDHA